MYAYYPTPYPVYYYPYAPGAAFATGVFFGAATAWACNWSSSHVEHNVNVNRTDNLNVNRNNPQYQQRADQARQQGQQRADQARQQGQQRADQARQQGQQRADQTRQQGQQRADQARQQAQQRGGGQDGGSQWQSQKRPGEVSGGAHHPGRPSRGPATVVAVAADPGAMTSETPGAVRRPCGIPAEGCRAAAQEPARVAAATAAAADPARAAAATPAEAEAEVFPAAAVVAAVAAVVAAVADADRRMT